MKKITVLLFLSLVFSNFTQAQANLHKIEASFIVNFFRYIQWPEVESGSDFVVGVYGKSHPISKELDTKLAGKMFFGASFVVKEIASIDELSSCDVIFVPQGKVDALKKISNELKANSTLVITEESFKPENSIINFKIIDNKLKFSVNEVNAEKNNLQISSKLLAIAN